MFLFYAVHHPHPEKEELLIRSMRNFGELIKKQPGIMVVDTFRDPDNGTLLGVSIWESRDAFQAVMPALQDAFPSEEWEVKPREVHMLDSAM